MAGYEQALYDFVPIPERKPLKWPNGKRLALMITLNLEYWELTQDHDGPYFARRAFDQRAAAAGAHSGFQQSLLARVRPPRRHLALYEIFDEAKVPASCTVNGILCERHPQIVTAAAKRGWELIAHNYIQTEFLINYRDDRAKEREVIKRIIDLIEKTTGRRPKGWLSSSLRCTVNTSDICKELGLTYHCDYMNDEQPYLINTDARSAGVDPLYAGGQRHRHVPAPQSHRDGGLRAAGRTSSTSSTGSARRADGS